MYELLPKWIFFFQVPYCLGEVCIKETFKEIDLYTKKKNIGDTNFVNL